MLVYAHRGSSGTEPENTLRAFKRAIDDGADGIEFDVHATADGVPVVIHDRSLARTTTGEGLVNELTLEQVRSFDAGGGQPVPTLVEVLDVVAGRLRLDIEVKQPGIAGLVLEVLSNYPAAEWVIGSFNWSILEEIRALAPSAKLRPIANQPTEEAFASARALGATAISLRADTVTPEIAQRIFAEDLDLVVWTVNRVEDAKRARHLGASALCTDMPGEIIRGLATDMMPTQSVREQHTSPAAAGQLATAPNLR